jgi:MoxR-like ATPase
MAVNIQNKLGFWIKNNLNVLFIGKHGVGKTAMVKQAFDEHNLNWRYFSASTMDPWVDFVGVPKEKSEGKFGSDQFEVIRELINIDQSLALEWIEKNWHLKGESAQKVVQSVENRRQFNYLELVRPRTFATGEVEALFFDEFNRSPKKVRNAVMELLQFKSINGEKFPNLKIVWAAINPDDDEDETYDVEKLDPAQQDRYHVITTIPYLPNTEWFRQKFGRRLADSAIGWWKELTPEMQNVVSPRRLEYALNMFQLHGDIRDVIPHEAGVSKLANALNTGPTSDRLSELMEANDVAGARTFLSNENNFAAAMKFIPESDTLMNFFLPLISKEKIASSMADNAKIRKHIITNSDKIPVFMNVCDEILKAGTDQKTGREIRKVLQQNQELARAFATKSSGGDSEVAEAHYTGESAAAFTGILTQLRRLDANTPQLQQSAYEKIEKSLPKDMTADQALNALEVLSASVGKMWPASLTSPPFAKLPGVVNHCIKEIHRNTGHNWSMILSRHGGRFVALMTKLNEAGLSHKLVQPK